MDFAVSNAEYTYPGWLQIFHLVYSRLCMNQGMKHYIPFIRNRTADSRQNYGR